MALRKEVFQLFLSCRAARKERFAEFTAIFPRLYEGGRIIFGIWKLWIFDSEFGVGLRRIGVREMDA